MRTKEELEKKKEDLWAAAEKADEEGWNGMRDMLTTAAQALEWALGSGTSWLENEEERKENLKKLGLVKE